MAIMKITKNMGGTDRIVRGVLGGLILLNGILNENKSPLKEIEIGIGGAFFLYGLTGFDPLLKAFGASTIPDAENNILHQVRQMTPGKGINPMLTQQAIPRRKVQGINTKKKFADSLVIR